MEESEYAKQRADEIGLKRCPNGCSLDMIEIGKEHESFHAVIGLNHRFIRCSECGFNDKTDDYMPTLAIDDETAINHWNDAVDSFSAARAAQQP